MLSTTSSEGSRLVRIVVPCAQTRVAIETHSRANNMKRCTIQETAQQAIKPRAKREVRSVLYHSLVIHSMFKQSENVMVSSSS